ncbi:methylthioribose-1-phosphate isomerase [Planococcus donghaensis MPA1U2]|uniref:Methylthioribose-1-phosphate isomerase n=1 Tax=Planococcus donghaensis MPA1U2 TaxID=933115 RepID=E7RDT3_9BACL|nr:S-methyl-5-thioribose-1-phosphate isomerase [Planococcus donghaensis]EGA90839.1 methylthioribose-1-phosphate isomerase [Planococcus donghaensis MPA1U2]
MTEALVSIEWKDDELVLLDQTILPNEIAYDRYTTIESVWDAIVTMKVRGAPAIGVTAAYGIYLSIRDFEGTPEELKQQLQKSRDYLATSRPTAVNLFWAIDRMMTCALSLDSDNIETIKEILLEEAKKIHREDEEINRQIGEHLLTLLEDGNGVLTHCNAGALATSKYGTATSPFYLAKEKGWDLKVFADETRPRLQGSTLTALELHRAGIDVTVITDSMAAMVMSQGKIQAAIVGCDRVAANGDTANKIGTLGVAILAKHYNVPFYIAAPTPTIDMDTPDGSAIPIEERHIEEIINSLGKWTAPKDVQAYNPAFDVTPANLITAIVTEKGIVHAPFEENFKKLFA